MLRTRPAVATKRTRDVDKATLWIAPPIVGDDLLSADVQCLKSQAYLAFRLGDVAIRTDIDPAGALDNRLPNLHVDHDTLLPAHHIEQWADQHRPHAPLSDESRAWIALLEGPVHAALIVATPAPSYLQSLLSLSLPSTVPLNVLLTPPPPPLTGIASLFPPFGTRISYDTIYARYCDAITALSDRLGTDKWFLGEPEPTTLDALAFAYLHSIVVSKNSTLRVQVTRHVNLVAWEWRVREQVRAAFK